MTASFQVDTDGYRGPVGLLLSLISAQKVDLWQLSVSELVDAYLAELEKMRELDLEIATEFLVVAATLLELKCRRLFPDLGQDEIDEDFAFFEERDLLLARLLEVKTYRDASDSFVELLESASHIVPHVGYLEEPYASLMPDLLFGVTPGMLAKKLERFIAAEAAKTVDVSHLPEHPISVQEAARDVVHRLVGVKKCTFDELMDQAATKFEVVVGFLVILELYRQSRIQIDQERSMAEICIEWKSESLSSRELDNFLESSGFLIGD